MIRDVNFGSKLGAAPLDPGGGPGKSRLELEEEPPALATSRRPRTVAGCPRRGSRGPKGAEAVGACLSPQTQHGDIIWAPSGGGTMSPQVPRSLLARYQEPLVGLALGSERAWGGVTSQNTW